MSQTTDNTKRELIVIRGDMVEKRKVSWIWPKRFPAGATSVLGEGGIGKGLLTALVTSALTRGKPISQDYSESEAVKGEVMVISNEDSIESVLAPRFEAGGADMSKVHFVKTVKTVSGPKVTEKFIDIGAHLELIETALRDNPNIRLVIIDPVTNHLDSHTNPNDDVQVRRVLNPLNRMGETFNCTVLMVFHPNKKEDLASAKNRAPGAGAWINLPRASWLLAVDPKNPDRRLFVPLKYNYIKRGEGGLGFLTGETNIDCGGTAVPTPCLRLDGTTPVTADELMNKDRNRVSKLEIAVKFLRQVLAAGAMRQSKIYEVADQQGIRPGTLAKAKKDARVTSEKPDKTWTWRLLTEEEENAA